MRMLVLGKTQSGKSWWVYHKIYPQFQKSHFLIYLDPKPSLFVVPITKLGLIIYEGHLKHISKRIDLRIAKENRELILKPHLRKDFETEAMLLLDELIEKKASGEFEGKVLVVIDEAHRFGTKAKVMPEVSKIVKEGEVTRA